MGRVRSPKRRARDNDYIVGLSWSWRVTPDAPGIVLDVSSKIRNNHQSQFSWQAQYLVMLDCYFSWQAQHFVKFWEIAEAPNVVFFHIQNVSPRWDEYKVSEAVGARWRFYRRIILGSCSECRRIVFILAEAIQRFLAQILNSEFRGRLNIWWCWTV